MLYPSIFGENLFDDFFRFPDFGRDVEKKLYGKHAAQVMKTDVHEHDDHYEIVIDLPGTCRASRKTRSILSFRTVI